jgi:threonyl-tRNA synthetase
MDLFHFEPEYAPGSVFWPQLGQKVLPSPVLTPHLMQMA